MGIPVTLAKRFGSHSAVPSLVLLVLVAGGCTANSRNGWIGLNTNWAEPMAAETEAGPSPAILKELKVRQVREAAMDWAAIQPSSSAPLDFSSSDQAVRAVQKADAELLVVFGNIPAWAGPLPGEPAAAGLPARERSAAFTDFVSRFVERYDHDGRSDMPSLSAPVNSFQFICEMEDLPPAEYAWWLKLFNQAVKRANPRATVVMGGLSSPGVGAFDQQRSGYTDYLERLLAEPELAGPGYPHFDVVAFHNFPERYPGRFPFDEAVAYLRQTMARHDLSLPIWLTAYGASGSAERLETQADNIVKWSLKARTIGVQRMYLHGLADWTARGHGSAVDCGLLARTPEGQTLRKPGFYTFQKLLEELEDRPDVSFRGEGLYVLSGKGAPRYVIWKEELNEPAPMSLPGWWSVESFTGPKTVLQGNDIRPTGSPFLIERTISPFIH